MNQRKGALKERNEGLLRSGMWDARVMRKDRRRYETRILKKYRGDWGLVLSSHYRKGRSCKRMNGGRKGKSSKRRLRLESTRELPPSAGFPSPPGGVALPAPPLGRLRHPFGQPPPSAAVKET